jgi:signal transduction histidine kinase
MWTVNDILRFFGQSEGELLKEWKQLTIEQLPHLPESLWTARGKLMRAGKHTLQMWAKLHLLYQEEPDSTAQQMESLLQEVAVHWMALDLASRDKAALVQALGQLIEAKIQQNSFGGEATLLQSSIEARLQYQILRLQYEQEAKELAQLRQEALSAQHIVERFLAHSSHELRTPLTAILGFAEILSEGIYGEMTPAQQQAVGHIENSAHNLVEIVNNMLDMLRMRSGKLNLYVRPFALLPVLRDIHAMLIPLSQRKNVTLQFELAENLGTIEADENVLRHILYHLLTSSLRATPAEGVVSLRASQEPDSLLLVVEDTALHLPPEALTQLQSHLPRIENAPVRGYEQWEIGLPLVRRYVEMQGGTLDIENLHGGGIRFRITIPTRTKPTRNEVVFTENDTQRVSHPLHL